MTDDTERTVEAADADRVANGYEPVVIFPQWSCVRVDVEDCNAEAFVLGTETIDLVESTPGFTRGAVVLATRHIEDEREVVSRAAGGRVTGAHRSNTFAIADTHADRWWVISGE